MKKPEKSNDKAQKPIERGIIAESLIAPPPPHQKIKDSYRRDNPHEKNKK